MRVLKSTDSHPTADWIYEKGRKEMPNISLGTVYRNLNMLKAKGTIIDLGFAGVGLFGQGSDMNALFTGGACKGFEKFFQT